MLHAPLVISTAKLDIGSLLTSSPSPPRQNQTPTSRPPPFSRSISVPSSTVQFPIVTSPSTSSTSHYSTSTAPPQGYGQIQTAPLGGRQPASGASSKRGPPINPDPLASPNQKRQKKWTARENALLVSLRGANVKWGDISKQIPGRSNTSCRLRYQNYVEKDTAWTDEKKDKLARLYERLKPELWGSIAKELEVPWRTVEAMHWQIGEVEMARRAGVRPFNKNPTAGSSSAGRPAADVDTDLERELEYTGPEAGGGLAPMGRHGRRPRRRHGDNVGRQTGLPSLAEMMGSVPAFAGFGGGRMGFEEEDEENEEEEEEEEEEENDDDDDDEDDDEEEDVGGIRHEIKREMKRE